MVKTTDIGLLARFTASVPKFNDEVLKTRFGNGATPIPVIEIATGGALLDTLTLLRIVPEAAGTNVILSVTDCVGTRVVPGVIELALNPTPGLETPEIVTFEVPLFVRIMLFALELPSFTSPKLTLVVLARSDRLGEGFPGGGSTGGS